ncbi:MAG: carbohydrate ABC transporter permease [Myxococcota bacterium]
MMTSSSRTWRCASGLVASMAGLLWVGPYLWMVSTSFKGLPELVAAPTAPLPAALRCRIAPGDAWCRGLAEVPSGLEGYRAALETMPVAHYLFNTLLMATLIALLQVALALPAGYALAKLRFAGRRAALGLVLACLVIPAQVTFVPVFVMLGSVGLANTMAALVLPFGVSAFGTFLVRQAMLGVPDSIIEAARLDGASEFTIVFRVLGPIVQPTLVAHFLFSFVFHYSDYFWPLMMTTDESVRTLPLAVALLREQGTGTRWHIVMAGNVLLSVPVLVLFGFAQRRIMRAVTARALS